MPDVLQNALTLLESPSWTDRVDAVRRLTALDDPRALEGLSRALHDSRDTAVIEAAAKAFLERFDSYSMGVLTEASRSEDFEVCQTVTDVLYGASERGRFAQQLLDEG
jgi:HEAT repeat protein